MRLGAPEYLPCLSPRRSATRRRGTASAKARRSARSRRGGMALRATALRRLAPALASAGVALAWREQSRTAAEPAQQRLFSCGMLRPSDTGDKVPARAPPSEAAFWASKGLRVVNMSYGQHHAAAVDHRGGVWAWASSEPTPRQLPCRSRIASVASTDASLYAVTSKGKVLEWRDLFSADASADALALPSAEPRPLGGGLAKVTAASVAAGANHVLIVGKKGELVGLGDNRCGQLGLGAPEERPGCTEPTLLGPFASPVVAAACGGGHSVVALADGSCLSFGDDRHLQLGVRSPSIKDLRRGYDQQGGSTLSRPRPVEQMQGRHVTKVAAGGGGKDGGHTAFVVRGEAGDEVWMCGNGRWGQLGSKRFDHVSEPQLVGTLSRLRQYDEALRKVQAIRVLEVGCGARHTAVVLETGNVFVWGWNDKGQLGTLVEGQRGSPGTHTPTMLKAPSELRFTPLRGLCCGPSSTSFWS